MKTITVVLILSVTFQLSSQDNCLQKDNLKKLDASWEKAQLELDVDFLASIIAEEFIWVHNHANTIDNKSDVINRAKRYLKNNTNNTKSRLSKDVQVIISGNTGIVNGYTIIDRGPSPTTYHFMRTYVKKDGACLLLANQTMAIPEKD